MANTLDILSAHQNTIELSAAPREPGVALGTAPTLLEQTWTVDDTLVDIDIAASGEDLVFTYQITGLPPGLVQNGSRLQGRLTEEQLTVANIGIEAIDQFNRILPYALPFTASYRPQATAAGGLGPYTFTALQPIPLVNLAGDFTANGNTLTFAITGPSLPEGLAASTAGAMTGTPNAAAAEGDYTLRATDEYGRDTDSVFTLTVSPASSGDVTAPVFDSISYDAAARRITAALTEASNAATIVWATADPSTDPTYDDGTDTWTGTVYETGSFGVTAPSGSGTASLTAATPDGAREMTVYAYDAAGNLSGVQRLAFTKTPPPAAGGTTFLAQTASLVWTAEQTFSNGTHPAIPSSLTGQRFAVVVALRNTAQFPSNVRIGGTAATPSRIQSDSWNKVAVYDAIAGSANNNIVVTLPAPEYWAVAIYSTDGTYLGGAEANNFGPAPLVHTLSQNTVAGEAVIGGCASNDLTGLELSGLVQRGSVLTIGGRSLVFFDNLNVAGGTPQAFTATLTGGATRYNNSILARYG